MAIRKSEVKELMSLNPYFKDYLNRLSSVNLSDIETGFRSKRLGSMSNDDYHWIIQMESMFMTLKVQTENIKKSVNNYFDSVDELKKITRCQSE